jgi:hypothetical protein
MAGLRKPWIFASDEDYPGRFYALHRALSTARHAADPTSEKQTRALVRELNRQYEQWGTGRETAGTLVNPHERAWVLFCWYWGAGTPEIRIPQIFGDAQDAHRIITRATGDACYSAPQPMRAGDAWALVREWRQGRA